MKGQPVVSIAQGLEPKRVTLIYPFYENPYFLGEQVSGWWKWPEELRACVAAIIVDDGSPTPACLPVWWPFPIRLFRIGVDVRWNWLAARNIGAHHARDGWLLLTDMDHVVPEDTLCRVLYGQHDPHVIYGFSRREHTGETIAPHSASFLMTRELFWTIGGYDERLSGFYGSDGDWRRRCAAVAPMQILTDALVRYEFVGDSSTTRYKRKQPEDVAIKHIVAARGTDWKVKTLSFPYAEVTRC